MKRAPHIELTERQFRQRKRRETLAVVKALDDLRIGCAFLPREAQPAIAEADRAIAAVLPILRKWWRKS